MRASACLVVELALLMLAAANAQRGAGLDVTTRIQANAQARRELLGYDKGDVGLSQMGRRLHQAGGTPVPKPASSQIFLSGIIQVATLDSACNQEASCGGTITVNGITVIVPKNLVVFFPAQSTTWEEVFRFSPKSPASGLALVDPPSPPGTSYIADVTANRLVDGKIIAALISITQAPLVTGTGYIDDIDYATGVITLEAEGGVAAPGGTLALGTPGAKLRLNDPSGRFGMAQTGLDPRFTVDTGNPTVRAATGYPMCVPTSDTDDKCPMTNRPQDSTGRYLTTWTCADSPGGALDATKMTPFIKGDRLTYAGIVTQDGSIAAYEVVADLAIYTAPGTDPAYMVVEVALVGTGGFTIGGALEAAGRARFEGFTTDPTRPIQLYARDWPPASDLAPGDPNPPANPPTPVDRDWGMVKADPGLPFGAVAGRWRFQPPCTNSGPITVNSPFLGTAKGCTPPAGGSYNPVPREIAAQLVGCNSPSCYYFTPTIEYLWPENVPGTPAPENNFNSLPFLTSGGYPSGISGYVTGTLDPWPSPSLPEDSCLTPRIDVGKGYVVSPGGSVKLTATVTGPGKPFIYSWMCNANPPELCGRAAQTNNQTVQYDEVFPTTVLMGMTNPPDTISYTVQVVNKCMNVYRVTVSVSRVTSTKLVVMPIQPVSLPSGGTGNIGAMLDIGNQKATWNWTFPDAAGFTNVLQAPTAPTLSPNSQVQFVAPVLPWGTPQPQSFSVFVQANPAPGSTMDPSAPVEVTVLVAPPMDSPSILAVGFDCKKRRLSITARDTMVNPNLKLYLLPYMDNQGKMVNTVTDPALPGALLANQGAGNYALTIVSAVHLPSLIGPGLQIVSNLGALSPEFVFPFSSITPKGVPCPI